MTRRDTNRPQPGCRITREELDRLFDREFDQCERRDFVARLARDPDACDEVNEVRGMVHSMRLRPDETPDMTEAVLARLDRERGFLSPRMRRRVKAGRMAVAASLLVGLLGVAIAHRVAPERFRFNAAPTPVADLTDAVRQDSIEGRDRIARAVAELASAAESRRAEPPAAGATVPPAKDINPFASPLGVTEGLNIASPVPGRYLTLTVSADAEVLALQSGIVLPTSDVAGVPAIAWAPDEFTIERDDIGLPAFAFTFSTGDPRPILNGGPATAIPRGVLPLSFMGDTRSAYVGKRSFLPSRIEHAPRHPVSTLDDRP